MISKHYFCMQLLHSILLLFRIIFQMLLFGFPRKQLHNLKKKTPVLLNNISEIAQVGNYKVH